MNSEQFLVSYAERSEMTREQVLDGRVVATCNCDYDGCDGFQVNSERNLLPWRDEVVLIRI